MTKINYYADRVCLNVLAGSLENAKDIYKAANKNVVVGVLSASYSDIPSAIADMKPYNEALEGNLSVGLGGGNPAQCHAVAEIVKQVKANHVNQVFTAVGYTRANIAKDDSHINAMVAPSGTVGMVNIATGELSKGLPAANVPIETAIAMVKEMGGNSLKFFPMNGLACMDELKAVASACAESDFILEPTGGIDLMNYKEIMHIILSSGVKRVIPHIYSSIIDKESGNTRIDDVETLVKLTEEVIASL